MTRGIPDPAELHSSLLGSWRERCRRSGIVAADVAEADARRLVVAVLDALDHGTETAELGRAARTWGTNFASPVEALAAVTCLREVLAATANVTWTARPVDSPGLGGAARVIDQLMLESVDAAAGALRASARVDPLTGCANRRALHEDLPHAVAGARRSGLDLSLAMVDLDGLKAINDRFGHAAGDATLVSLVTVLRGALRDVDGLYRSGGDEFVIVSPFTDDDGARRALARAEEKGGPAFSWGVAGLSILGAPSPDDPQRLLQAADADLYARRRARRRAIAAAARRRRGRAVASMTTAAVVTAGAAFGLASLGGPTPPGIRLVSPAAGAATGSSRTQGGPGVAPHPAGTTSGSGAGSPSRQASGPTPSGGSPTSPSPTGHLGDDGDGADRSAGTFVLAVATAPRTSAFADRVAATTSSAAPAVSAPSDPATVAVAGPARHRHDQGYLGPRPVVTPASSPATSTRGPGIAPGNPPGVADAPAHGGPGAPWTGGTGPRPHGTGRAADATPWAPRGSSGTVTRGGRR